MDCWDTNCTRADLVAITAGLVTNTPVSPGVHDAIAIHQHTRELNNVSRGGIGTNVKIGRSSNHSRNLVLGGKEICGFNHSHVSLLDFDNFGRAFVISSVYILVVTNHGGDSYTSFATTHFCQGVSIELDDVTRCCQSTNINMRAILSGASKNMVFAYVHGFCGNNGHVSDCNLYNLARAGVGVAVNVIRVKFEIIVERADVVVTSRSGGSTNKK